MAGTAPRWFDKFSKASGWRISGFDHDHSWLSFWNKSLTKNSKWRAPLFTGDKNTDFIFSLTFQNLFSKLTWLSVPSGHAVANSWERWSFLGLLLSVNGRRRNLSNEAFRSVFWKRPTSGLEFKIRGLYHYTIILCKLNKSLCIYQTSRSQKRWKNGLFTMWFLDFVTVFN